MSNSYVVKYEHIYEKKIHRSQDSCYFLEGEKAVRRELCQTFCQTKVFFFFFYWSDMAVEKCSALLFLGVGARILLYYPLIFFCMFGKLDKENSHGILHPLTWAVMSMVLWFSVFILYLKKIFQDFLSLYL